MKEVNKYLIIINNNKIFEKQKSYLIFLYFKLIYIVLDSEISMVVMLYRTNILALVGSESNPIHNKSKVIIWDDHQKKSLSELRFNQTVLNIKLRKDKIIIILQEKIYLFDIETFQNLDIIETGENPNGVIGLNYSLDKTLIGYPDKKKGKIKIKNYDDPKNELFIDAHDKIICNMVMTINGDLLASATEKGTIIRIFNTEFGNLIQEIRRGSGKAEIKCICIDPDYKFIAASSNKNKIHIWSLSTAMKKLKRKSITEDEDEKEKNNNDNEKVVDSESIKNRKRIKGINVLPNVIPGLIGGDFLSSEYSFAQVKVNEPGCIITFGSDNSLIMVSTKGKYFKAKIDLQKGGICQIVQEEQFS